jgi:hypothetical protein
MTRPYIKHGGTRRNNPDRPRYNMWHAARARARREGVAFTITVDDIYVPDHCPVCGVEMQQSLGTQGGAPNSPSLDRVTPEHGYVPDNIWVICFGDNARKGDRWDWRYEEAFARYQFTRWDCDVIKGEEAA